MAQMQSVERVSGILLAFTAGNASLGVSELSRSLQLPKSAVYRTLDALVETGLVTREVPGSRYRLGPRALDIGLAAVGGPDTRATAMPLMHELRDRTGETVTLSFRLGYERVYVDQAESPQDVRMTVEVGKRAPLYAGASGRAILAYLASDELEGYLARTKLVPLTPSTIIDVESLRNEVARVRSAGYASSAGERDPWAAAVAAPIFVAGERPIGSMSVCGPRPRFTAHVTMSYGAAVHDTAARLSRQLA